MKDLELELKTLQFKYDLLKKTQEGSLGLLGESLVSKIDQLILTEEHLSEGWKREEKLVQDLKETLQELKETLLELQMWKKHAHKQKPNEDRMRKTIQYFIRRNDALEEELAKVSLIKGD